MAPRKPKGISTPDLEAAVRPSTNHVFGVLAENTRAMTVMGSGLDVVKSQLSTLESVTRTSDGRLAQLVELSADRTRREQLEYEARIAKERASAEASVLRTSAEISEASARGNWRRSFIDKMLLPIGTAIAGAIVSWAAVTFSMSAAPPSTQVNVERPVPEPAAAPVLPDPEPESQPEPEPAPRPRSHRPELLELEP